MVIDLATRHVGERTNIEVETVEIVEVVRMRGALGRRWWWRWSVGHGCGAFIHVAVEYSKLHGREPGKGNSSGLGRGFGSLFSARLSGYDSGSDKSWDELSNWKYGLFRWLEYHEEILKSEKIYPGGNKVFWCRIGAFYPSILFLDMAMANS